MFGKVFGIHVWGFQDHIKDTKLRFVLNECGKAIVKSVRNLFGIALGLVFSRPPDDFACSESVRNSVFGLVRKVFGISF